jgi:glycine betaine catabolism B
MLKLKSVNFEQQKFEHHEIIPDYPGQLEWLVGRKNTCDLVLSCPEVSRVHGRIIYSDARYHFVDVGSTSGSMLNGEVVPINQQRQLGLGDLLQLGKTLLYVEEVAPPIEAPQAEHSTYVGVASESAWTKGDLSCRCCRIVDETHDVKTFYFMAESPSLFAYQPGQFVNLAVMIEGQRVIRPYSISSSPTRPHHLSITVKRVPRPNDQPDAPAGLVSNWLHDHLQVGDRVTLMGGPMGHFTCLPNLPPKLLLLSAGSGITPMMSMSRWVQDTLADCDVMFFHSARSLDDIVFRAELEMMATQMPNFRLAVTLTQKPTNHPWMGLTGRISESMMNLIAPDLDDRTVFVCGPNAFMKQAKAMLTEMNFPMANYHEESFGDNPRAGSAKAIEPTIFMLQETETLTLDPAVNQQNGSNAIAQAASNGSSKAAPTVSNGSSNASPVVNFTQSNQAVSADDGMTILELAEQAGVDVRSACRMGACGACKLKTSAGEVRYDAPPMALTEADQQAGCVLACVAYPVGSVQVEA